MVTDHANASHAAQYFMQGVPLAECDGIVVCGSPEEEDDDETESMDTDPNKELK